MNKINFIFFFIYFILLTSNLSSNITSSIIVKIDNKIITNYEVKNKIMSTLIISNNEITQTNIDNLKESSLNNLIFLKLKEIELEKYDFEINQNQVLNYLKSITKNKTLKVKEEFEKYDLDFNLLLKEIEIELKWRQFIFSRYSNRIDINEKLIDEEIKKISLNMKNDKEVNISEIEIFKNENVSNDVLIKKIIEEINSNGFENTALKLSVSNTASQKGGLGWVNTNILSSEIKEIIKKLKPGQISKPIIKSNSILFLKLNSLREFKNSKVDKENLKKNLIQRKKNELFDLYSKSHLSKLKNDTLISYK